MANASNYKIVDSAQSKFFDDTKEIKAPKRGERFYGQDAHHQGNKPSYTDNGDGTITDNVTGLMWQKGYAVMSFEQAQEAAKRFKLAGHKDWRLPTIKEGYSLMMFSGADVNPQLSKDSKNPGTPFINTDYFDFKYGSNGNRPIDVQLLSSTIYVGSTERETLIFGVNVADGRIKGYGTGLGGRSKEFTVRFVRGGESGENDFADNGDGTISDKATSLMWSKEDSKAAMNWEQALAYAQQMNSENYLGHSDWRVPNAKELQSLVDYTRSPLSTTSAAIDPLFAVSTITDESGAQDFPFYWSSTTHENSGGSQGSAAIYVSFGRSLGNMSNISGMGGGPRPQGQGGQGGQRPPQGQGQMRQGGPPQGEAGQRPQRPQGEQAGQGGQRPQLSNSGSSTPNWIDVHGAGSQRSDPKTGDPSKYANGHGPQGDVIRINNYVRLVRDL